jgi:hypothetical protein
MKRAMTFFAAVSLLTLMPAAPAAAAPNPYPDLNAVNFCRVDVPTNHPDQSLGNCVGFQSLNYRDNFNGLVSHLCSYLESQNPDLFYAYYDTFDECVVDKASVFLG